MMQVIFSFTDASTGYSKNVTLTELGARGVQLSYSTDSPDTLQIVLSPEVYASKLNVAAGGRLNVYVDGQKAFAGTLASGAQYDYDASSTPRVTLEFQSDYYLLDSIVYAALVNGEAVFSRRPVKQQTTSLQELVSSINSWLGIAMPSTLVCSLAAKVQTPQSNGTASCASLLTDAMRWVPDAVLVQRYASGGDTLRLVQTSSLPELTISAADKLQSFSVQARNDLRTPVCALVGGARGIWPAGADIRTPGAFVYAVPLEKDSNSEQEAQRGAGESPASSKMVVRGVALPEAKTYEHGEVEYNYEKFAEDSLTQKFIKRFFPELAPLRSIGYVGACYVEPLSKEDFQAELNEGNTEDEVEVPANYADVPEVQSWGHNVYVHTEGSFPASPLGKKNIKGLKWCKAQISFIYAVKQEENRSDVQKTLISEFLPGKQVSSVNKTPFRYVKKTLSCTLINRRKRVFDPATNALCSSDPNYAEEGKPEQETESLSAADYKAAMEAYYQSARVLQYEGSASLLNRGSLQPWAMTGMRLNIAGWNPAWASMNAIVRSVSWDLTSGKLSLSFGPRSVMGFDELLERRAIARTLSLHEAHNSAITYDPADEATKEKAEESMAVSPSISAGIDTSSTGKHVKPFTLYWAPDGKSLWLAGGTLRKNGHVFEVPSTDQQITEGKENGSKWEEGKKLRCRVKTLPDGTTTYDIYQ